VVACHLCYTDRLKVAIHYVMILSMSSQHAEPAITVRAPKDLSDEAKDVLKARGRTMRAFVVACLTRLTTDSGNFLALLDDDWPPEKPRGRPRQTPTEPDGRITPLPGGE